MLEQLIKRAKYWTHERINKEIYKGLLDNSNSGQKYFFEKNDYGFYICQMDSVTFFQINTGLVFRLDKNWCPVDYKCQLRLYELSQTLKTFKIDQILEYKEIKINNEDWRYTLYQRAGFNTGVDFAIDVSNGIVNKDYVKEWVHQTIPVLTAIKQVTKIENCLWTKKAIWLTSRLRINDDYVWKSKTRWCETPDRVRIAALKTLTEHLGHAFIVQNQLYNTRYKANDIKECVDYADEQWKPVIC